MHDDEFRKARLEKALSEARYIASLTKLNATELVLADEVLRMRDVHARIRAMVTSWRDCARDLRVNAEQWRLMGESFSWHAVRAESNADILETQALILESILTTR